MEEYFNEENMQYDYVNYLDEEEQNPQENPSKHDGENAGYEYMNKSDYLEKQKQLENPHQGNSSKIIAPVDPLDLKDLEFVIPNKGTRNHYTKKWIDFVKFCGLSKTVAPSEEKVLAFFEQRSKNCSGSTLWSAYSSLNTVFNLVYKFKMSAVSMYL